ncbi:helix-turn-helix domain-containing protein [Carnobacterium gallinarum]|uniref:helix-turn-helix domain-containing protein n=1 Tax=Carnobacterium gallinarum TaxID=2749 RepID=UPI0005509678|nr:helix-turn-helix domain-containing protein [Carnobacterium gallinarum]
MNEIGIKLQEARKAKGYTLDDLQQMTKIQKRYLIAIEEGNFDVMPGKFYARAFIKQYADTVGLNGDQLLEQYTDAVPHTHDEEYVEKVNTNQTRSENHVTNELLERVKTLLPTILIVIVVFLIIGGIWYAATKTGNKDTESIISKDSDTTSITTSSNTATSESKTSAASSSSKEPEKEPEKPKQAIAVESSTGQTTNYTVTNATEPGSIVLSAEGGASWVGVEVNGVAADQKTMQSGDNLEVPLPAGTTSISVRIGNAASTKITLNGEAVAYAPEATNVITQTLVFTVTPVAAAAQ